MSQVSVIIPCYNQGHYINEAVNSVINQSFSDVEIIVVNDGSTDEATNQVLENLIIPKGKIIHTPNQGLPTARNTGIRSSTGKFLLPLDSDNKIKANFIERTIAVFNRKPDVDIVYTNGEFFGDKSGIWEQPKLEFPLFLKRNLIDACAIFKREVWVKCAGYNPNMLYGWEDWDFWLRAHEQGFRFHHLEEVLFYYRVACNSMVTQIATEEAKRHYLEHQLINNHISTYSSYFPEPLTLLRELDFLRKEKIEFEKYKADIYKTFSYRIGDAILKPIKWLRKLK